MKAFDFTTIPEDVRAKIEFEISRYNPNCEIILITKISDNPKDFYLYVVIAKGGYRDGYNVWLYNSDCGGLFEGHYDMDFVDAMKYFANTRINSIESRN